MHTQISDILNQKLSSDIDGQKETDESKDQEVSRLVDNLFITIHSIDKAFEIAITIQDKTILHFSLSKVIEGYLKLNSYEGCIKAYKVALLKESKGDHIAHLLKPL